MEQTLVPKPELENVWGKVGEYYTRPDLPGYHFEIVEELRDGWVLVQPVVPEKSKLEKSDKPTGGGETGHGKDNG